MGAPNSAYPVAVDDTTFGAVGNPAVAQHSGRKRLYLRNNDATNVVYLDSNPGVTSDNGFPLLPGDVINETRMQGQGLDVQGAIYAVCATSETADLRVWERD